MKGFTHESSHNESKEWYTPPKIFEALDLTFDMDVASPGRQTVPWIPARRHITKQEDGLITPWVGAVWVNPPYGSDTQHWVKKFVEHQHGCMLVFARTDTSWFHNYGVQVSALVFIKGRVQFIRSDGFVGGGCGAASMLLAFGSDCVKALKQSNLGFFVDNQRK